VAYSRGAKPANIVCAGRVRALPSLGGIRPRKRVRLLAFFCQFLHLPVKPVVETVEKVPLQKFILAKWEKNHKISHIFGVRRNIWAVIKPKVGEFCKGFFE
jgi:hypothetical protein